MPPRRPDPESRSRLAETAGLILIALVIIVLTLARFWRVIHWSWR